jgi:hypothetical protein
MQSVTLSPELAFVLSIEAKRSGKTLAALVEEWLRQQYQTLRREQLALQTKKFWANHTTLYAQYPNQYVAFYDALVSGKRCATAKRK